MAKKAMKNYHPKQGILGESIVLVSVEKTGKSASCHISLQDLEIALEKMREIPGVPMKRVRDKIDRFLTRAYAVIGVFT